VAERSSSLSETEAALHRTAWIEEQLLSLIEQWRQNDQDDVNGTETSWHACADQLRQVIDLAGAPHPADHLAEAIRHIQLAQAQNRRILEGHRA
jgi:hypothetical protein